MRVAVGVQIRQGGPSDTARSDRAEKPDPAERGREGNKVVMILRRGNA